MRSQYLMGVAGEKIDVGGRCFASESLTQHEVTVFTLPTCAIRKTWRRDSYIVLADAALDPQRNRSSVDMFLPYEGSFHRIQGVLREMSLDLIRTVISLHKDEQ